MAHSRANGQATPNALAQFVKQNGNSLLALQQSETWNKLPRSVQRGYERFNNQAAFFVHLHQERTGKVEQLQDETLATIVDWARAWDERIEQQEDETEKLAMIHAKQSFLAAAYQATNATLGALDELHQLQLDEAMRQPAEHWVKATRSEHVADIASFGEAKLQRAGYPPLSAAEAWLNALTFGAIADKRFREHERARMLGQQRMIADGGAEDVVDVDFTTD